MKKIILFIFIFLGLFQITFADFKSDIKSRYEYITVTGEQFDNKYITNKGRDVYFIGQRSSSVIEDQNGIEYLKSKGMITKGDIFVFRKNKITFINIEDSKLNISKCNKIDLDSAKALELYMGSQDFDDHIISDYNGKVIGSMIDNVSCYYNDIKMYLLINQYSSLDIKYIVNNYKNISSKVSKISPSKDYKDANIGILRGVYDYILRNTSYNFEALKNYENVPSDGYLFRVAPFFQGKKLVCDGYSRTMDYMSKLKGVDVERVVGELQPTEKSIYNISGLGHSWIKYGDFYFDPTFDDSGEAPTDIYFAKPKYCFNLNHYTTGWVLFKNDTDKFNFIKENGENILNKCPEILRNVSMDKNLVELIKYSLNNYSLVANKALFCTFFNICDNFSSKQELLDRLKLYKFEITYGDEIINIDFSISLKDFKIQESTKLSTSQVVKTNTLTDKEMDSIKKTIDAYFLKLKGYSSEKRIKILTNIKNKLDKLSQNKNISAKTLFFLDYFNKLYILEKIN